MPNHSRRFSCAMRNHLFWFAEERKKILEDYLQLTVETYNAVAPEYVNDTQNRQPEQEFKRVLKIGAICCILVKEGAGEEMVEFSQEKLRFFTYFQRDEMLGYCLA